MRPELQVELRAALYRAFDQGEARSTCASRSRSTARRGSLLVRPGATATSGAAARARPVHRGRADRRVAGKRQRGRRAAARRRAASSTEELRQTRGQLAASREQDEADNEELRAANEELQSINEEYRSTAEELETSKEELQSINEELETVNAELKLKLEELSRAHSDLENLIAATEIGTLFLDRRAAHQRFTPPVADLFNVTESDAAGRSPTSRTTSTTRDWKRTRRLDAPASDGRSTARCAATTTAGSWRGCGPTAPSTTGSTAWS